MAYTSVHNGMIFIEGDEPGARRLGPVEYKKTSFYNQQLKDLDVVKEQMAEKAAAMGANAIIDFKYGQKSTTFFRSLLLQYDDNVNWYGTGTAVIISPERRREILTAKR